MENKTITCVGINALNECQSAYIGNGFWGCNFKGDCLYQRPRSLLYCTTENEGLKIEK